MIAKEVENHKKYETIIRVLKIFLGLTNRPMSYEDIYKYLEKENIVSDLSPELVNKYINTLRAAGLHIDKIQGRYTLFNSLVSISLTLDEIKTFKRIETAILKYGIEKNIYTFLSIKKKFLRFFDFLTRRYVNYYNDQILTTKMSFMIKQFEKLCADEQRLVIEYDNKVYTIEPKTIIFYDNNIYLEAINHQTRMVKKFLLEKVNLLEQQPVKNTYIILPSTVIYELTGNLAYTYKLKPNEEIIKRRLHKITVKSNNEDYEFLARRLIRYQNFCKIIYPESFITYFKNFVENILKVYDESNAENNENQ